MRWRPFMALCLCVAPLQRLAAAQPGGSAGARQASGITAAVRASITSTLSRLTQEGDFASAEADVRSAFDAAIAYAPTREIELFHEAAFAVRLVSQAARAPKERRQELVGWLLTHRDLAEALAFLVVPRDDPGGAYALLVRLRERYGDDLARFPSLAAAVCVVHDRPVTFRINENTSSAPDAVEIFEYFRASEKRLTFGVRNVPPELLLSVVDVTSPIEDLRWALDKYGGDPQVGKRYFDVPYDTAAFRLGATKRLNKEGFTLPNILAYGGVCADQAYFAMTVGKALGIPTAWVYGRNAEVSHAWVGFLEVRAGQPAWNFDSGRYDAYQGVRGQLLDLQSDTRITDSALALRAAAIKEPAGARRDAVAMTDACRRLAELQATAGAFPPPPPTGAPGPAKPVRQATLAARLDLLEAGLRRCPAYGPGWLVLRAMAAELSPADKRRWAGVLDNLCGKHYPDFSLDILRPMVESVEDPRQQDEMWNSMFNGFRGRPDLQAEIRFAQGAMWEKAGDRARAWDAYQDVIGRLANDGPFAVDAVRRCERLLADGGKKDQILPLLAGTWSKLRKPGDMAPEFRTQSNWVRVGVLYASRLKDAGAEGKADEVLTTLGAPKP